MLNTLMRALNTTPPADQGRCCVPQAAGPSPAQCAPGPLPVGYRRGRLPVAFAPCDDDIITQFGRADAAWIPEYMFWGLVGKAATYSPRTPLATSGTKGAGALTLSIALSAAVTTAQGNDYLFPGFVLEAGTNNNVAPGVIDLDISGTFEDGQPYTQTMQFNTGHVGVSRFFVAATRETQGGSYPSLINVSRDLIVVAGGTSIALTAAAAPNDATAIVPTNGIRKVQRDFTVTINQANQDTTFRLELLSPVGRFWDWFNAGFANSVQVG